MALRSTQPLTETSTRNISWGRKGGRCVGLTTLPPSCVECLETLDASTFWSPLCKPTAVALSEVVLPSPSRQMLVQHTTCLSNRPSACISAAPNGWIFVTFGIGDLYGNQSRNFKFGTLYVKTKVRLQCTHYFASRQQGKGNSPLSFRGNTRRFYIVNSYVKVNKSIKWTHC
jgi:hypothetical protein